MLAAVGQGSWHPANDATLWVKFNLRAHAPHAGANGAPAVRRGRGTVGPHRHDHALTPELAGGRSRRRIADPLPHAGHAIWLVRCGRRPRSRSAESPQDCRERLALTEPRQGSPTHHRSMIPGGSSHLEPGNRGCMSDAGGFCKAGVGSSILLVSTTTAPYAPTGHPEVSARPGRDGSRTAR